MNYAEYKEMNAEFKTPYRDQYDELFIYCTIGDDIWPKYAETLEGANTLDEFYEAIYQNDEFRGDKAWAVWARLNHSWDWADRFEAAGGMNHIDLGKRGLIIESEDGFQLIVPAGRRAEKVAIRIFADCGFNEDAADFFTTVSGKFKIHDVDVPQGVYDIYTSEHFVILEQWSFDNKNRRANIKGRTIKELEIGTSRMKIV